MRPGDTARDKTLEITQSLTDANGAAVWNAGKAPAGATGPPGRIPEGPSAPAGVPATLADATRRRRDMDTRLLRLRRDLGHCWAFAACTLGDGELWTGLRHDATPGYRPADWIVTATWQQMLWDARREHEQHPVPEDRQLRHRDDLVERLAAKRAGWAIVRLGGGDLLLARRGHVEAGPCPQAAMSSAMGQAVALAAVEASVRPCYQQHP